LNENRKKQIIFIGTMFVAVMFISSYAAFGNNSNYTSSSSTTTVSNLKTYFASGAANGIVSGYSRGATVELSNSLTNATTGNQIVGILSTMQANGSISSYLEFNNNFQVLLSTMNAYSLQQILQKKLNTPNVTVNASTYVVLPSRITLIISTIAAQIALSQTNYSISILPLKPPGTSIKININAIVWQNGTVANGQITLKPV
jgi:hypothetical protein